MRILLFSDIHSDARALEAIVATPADHYFAVGDLVNWNRGLDAVAPILQPLGNRLSVIPGNHESASAITDFCQRHGFHDMHGKTAEFGGYQVAALGYSNPTPFDTPGEYSEEEIASRLAPFAGLKPLILICHCPPLNTPLDAGPREQHFGSTTIAEFIDAQQPDWFFCGHIHEAAGIECTLGKTRARNLGKKGFVLEI